MTTSGNASTTKSTSKSTSQQKSTQSTQKRTQSTRTQARGTDKVVAYVRQGGERAIDLPVGAVLTARDRVTGAVQPWAGKSTRSRELQGIRRQVTTELGRFERRGEKARKDASKRVRSTVSTRVDRVENTVHQSRVRVEGGLKRAQASVQRVSPLV